MDDDETAGNDVNDIPDGGARRKVSRLTMKPDDDLIAVRKATLRAQAASQREQMRADDGVRPLSRPQDPKTQRPGEDLRPEDPKTPKTCSSSTSSTSSSDDPVVAVARHVVDQMHEYETPMWRAGFLLARALQQHGFTRRSDVLRRAARAAVERAEELDIVDWPWGEDDLEIDTYATWKKVKITEVDVVGTAARDARARPGTIDVPVPALIQVLVDVYWRLGQLGGRGVACPSQETLAKALGCTQRMVSASLTIAHEELGIIEYVAKFIPGRKGITWRVKPEHYTPPSEDA